MFGTLRRIDDNFIIHGFIQNIRYKTFENYVDGSFPQETCSIKVENKDECLVTTKISEIIEHKEFEKGDIFTFKTQNSTYELVIIK